jgi:hypothetical protein
MTLTELKIAANQRRRGAPRLRQVIPLLDKRSESAWESVMRVLHVAADIPVEPQHEIFDEYGRFVARVDLLIKGPAEFMSTTVQGTAKRIHIRRI